MNLGKFAEWLRRNRLDLDRWHARRASKGYRARLRIVRQLWTGAGLIVLLHPVPAFAIIVGLFTTFLGFTILDESVGTYDERR